MERGLLSVPDGLGSGRLRVFLSSTFTDTENERNAILKNSVPKLKAYARARGYDFAPSEMRWGVTKTHADNHAHALLCMREIHACQEESEGISFVSLLAQKYGFRPFPPTIDQQHFEAIKATLATNSAFEDVLSLLDEWFTLDSNQVPPQYVLSSISEKLPGYGNEAEPEKAAAASKTWWTIFDHMQAGLRWAADNTPDLPDNIRNLYHQSVTEEETRHALGPEAHHDAFIKDINTRTVWLRRHLDNLESRVSEKATRNFIDIQNGALDNDALEHLRRLEDEYIPAKGLTRITDYHLSQWDPEKGITPDIAEHKQYLQKICTDFEAVIMKSIDEAHARASKLRSDLLYVEIAQHAKFCRDRTSNFHGRTEVLEKIATYVASSQAHPLVVYGSSGSGKTSVMAKAAASASQRYCEQGSAVLLLRFIGTTGQSTTVVQLLQSLCAQMKRCYAPDQESIVQQDLPELIKDFEACMALASAEKPLMIFLDSLDQLSVEAGARELRWLPKKLPDHVRVVVSTLPEPNYRCFPRLKAAISDPSLFVQVPPLDVNHELPAIVDSSLAAVHRTLTPEQRTRLLDACKQCPLPLYVKLSVERAKSWRSFTPLDSRQCQLEPTVRGLITHLFEDLEMEHGRTFASHAFGCLTVAYRGLSDAEMEDILSCDEEVLNDVFEWWLPPFRRLPSLLWTRMRAGLGQFLVERGTGTSRVLGWHHRQFIEAAADRYLADPTARAARASALADYFMGTWADKEKPFQPSAQQQKRFNLPASGSAKRFVAAQPLVFLDGGNRNINTRKLDELPPALAQAGRLPELAETCLLDAEFVACKFQVFGKAAVMTDVGQYLDAAKGQQTPAARHQGAIKMLQKTLRVCPADYRQIVFQLLGRLRPIIAQQPALQRLFETAWASSVLSRPSLMPVNDCLAAPSTEKLRLFTHTDRVHGIAVSPDGQMVAVACDNRTVYVWDFESGDQLKALADHDWICRTSAFNRDGTKLATSSWSGEIRIYDTASWEVITTAMLQDEGKRIEAMLLTEVSSVGPVLLTGGNNIVHLLKLETLESVKSIAIAPGDGDGARIRRFCLNADGTLLGVGADAFGVAVYSFPDLQLKYTRSSRDCIGVSMIKRDSSCVIGDASSMQKVEAATGKQMWNTNFQSGCSLAASEDVIAVGFFKAKVQTYNHAGQLIRQLQGHSESVDAIVVRDHLVFSGGYDRTVQVFDSSVSESAVSATRHSGDVTHVAAIQTHAYSSDSTETYEWDLQSGRYTRTVEVGEVEMGQSQGVLLKTSNGVFNMALQKPTKVPGDHALRSFVSQNGEVCVEICSNGSLRVQDRKGGAPWSTPGGFSLQPFELGVNADAPYVVGPDGQVRSLESRKMPVLRTVDARSKKATIRTSVSPTGEFIAKTSKGGDLTLTAVATGQAHACMHDPDVNNFNRIIRVAGFTADGKYAISGGDDNHLKVWDVSTHAEVAGVTLDGAVFSLATTADDYFVVGTRGGGVAIIKFLRPDAAPGKPPLQESAGIPVSTGQGPTSSSVAVVAAGGGSSSCCSIS